MGIVVRGNEDGLPASGPGGAIHGHVAGAVEGAAVQMKEKIRVARFMLEARTTSSSAVASVRGTPDR